MSNWSLSKLSNTTSIQVKTLEACYAVAPYNQSVPATIVLEIAYASNAIKTIYYQVEPIGQFVLQLIIINYYTVVLLILCINTFKCKSKSHIKEDGVRYTKTLWTLPLRAG